MSKIYLDELSYLIDVREGLLNLKCYIEESYVFENYFKNGYTVSYDLENHLYQFNYNGHGVSVVIENKSIEAIKDIISKNFFYTFKK